MALALGVSPHGDVYVGDTRITIGEVFDPWQFEVVVHKDEGERAIVVSNDDWAEVLPQVYMMAGYKSSEGLLRLAIDAPRHIPIARGKLYREQNGVG